MASLRRKSCHGREKRCIKDAPHTKKENPSGTLWFPNGLFLIPAGKPPQALRMPCYRVNFTVASTWRQETRLWSRNVSMKLCSLISFWLFAGARSSLYGALGRIPVNENSHSSNLGMRALCQGVVENEAGPYIRCKIIGFNSLWEGRGVEGHVRHLGKDQTRQR